jgi:protein-disulfide isomerase
MTIQAWSRRAWLAAGAALVLWPALALAQPRPAPGADARLAALEREFSELRSELSALRERLDAIAGPAGDNRIVRISAGNSPAQGASGGAVTLMFFGDYQSVYSARAHYTIKRLLEEYPNVLKVVYKHYPLVTLHPQASEAALAAIAAEKQGKFWELNELLYQNGRRLDSGLYASLAEQAGLNLAQFERDRRAVGTLERLSEDEAAASQAGVGAVPALYLNGKPMQTWRYDYLRGQVEQMRKR